MVYYEARSWCISQENQADYDCGGETINYIPGPIIESKGMYVIFQKKKKDKKGQKMLQKGKKSKIFENLGNNVKI